MAMSNLQKDFIDSNELFINRLAKLSQEEVKLPKNRDKFIQEEITIKSNLANDLGLSSFDNDYYNKQIKMKVREMAEDRNPLLSTRQVKMDGGLLENDDERYGMLSGGQMKIAKAAPPFNEITADDFEVLRDKKGIGGIIARAVSKKVGKNKVSQQELEDGIMSLAREQEEIAEAFSSGGSDQLRKEAEKITKESQILIRQLRRDYPESRIIKELEEEGIFSIRDSKAEGGNVDEQMSMLMNNEQEPSMESEMPMESDEEMEDNYMDFIIDEALTEEEEDMLMSKLQQDEQLSMLFDKVVEVASEFAGSGPVEGPGTGVSDSIPARLSDGEFVFTAKAVEEIGADELMRMMKDAEMRADERQGMANGGEMDEETVVVKGDDEPARQEIRVVKETVDSAGRMVEDEDEISKNIKSNMMLDPNQQHVRS